MASLNDLPDEVLLEIISLTGRSLAQASRRYLRLYNRHYMDKVSKICALNDGDWGVIVTDITNILNNTADVREPIIKALEGSAVPRLDYHTFPEIMCVSWYLIYSMMQTLPFITATSRRDFITPEDVLVKTCHFGLPRAMVPDGPRMQLNMWVDVHNPDNLGALPSVGTQIRPEHDVSVTKYLGPPVQIADWIKERGLYCINLGTFSTGFLANYNDAVCIPMVIHTFFTEIGITNRSMPFDVLGYSFDTYKPQFTHPWIMFRIDSKFTQRFENIPELAVTSFTFEPDPEDIPGSLSDYPQLWCGTLEGDQEKRPSTTVIKERPVAEVLWEYPTRFKDGPISIPELCSTRIIE